MAISNAFNNDGGTVPTPSSSTLTIHNEDKTNLIDDERTTFSTNNAMDNNSLVVWLNGIKQRASEISINTSTEFALPSAPLSGDTLEVQYSTTT